MNYLHCLCQSKELGHRALFVIGVQCWTAAGSDSSIRSN
jgi:hypothetical protein